MRQLLALMTCLVLMVSTPLVSVAQGPQHLDSNSTFTTIDFPGAIQTRALGLSDRGEIVGDYIDPAHKRHGYLLSAGTFTTIDFPGAQDVSFLSGITSNGQIVGGYDDLNGVGHGFRLTDGNFSTLDFPTALFTVLIRVNEPGQVVGFYILAGQHGFLATPGPVAKP